MARRRCLQEARRFRLTEADAQDVAQEAVLRAWRRLGTLKDPASFEPWVTAIGRREALRHLASRAPVPDDHDGAEGAPPAADPIRRAEQRVDLGRVLGTLAPVDRAVLWLRFGEDLAHKQVGERLGLTETAVRVRTHRLRARLNHLSRAPEL